MWCLSVQTNIRKNWVCSDKVLFSCGISVPFAFVIAQLLLTVQVIAIALFLP